MPPYKVDVEHMLSACEVRNLYRSHNKAGEEEWYFSCPFHGEDNSPSCSMNADSTEWFCFTCHKRGNAVKFVSLHEGVSLIVASRWLREAYGAGFQEPWQGSLRAELDRRFRATAAKRHAQADAEALFLSDAYLAYFAVDWERHWHGYLHKPWETAPWARYLFERRFLPSTLDAYQVGYDHNSDRITLSVRDVSGKLVGFKGRAYQKGHKPKYLVLGGERYGFEPYSTGSVLYLLHTVTPGAPTQLIEGELNALMMRQLAFETAVGLSGSSLSTRQAVLLREVAGSVLLFYDGDEAGRDGQDQARRALEPYLPIRLVPDHERDPASMTYGEIVALVEAARGSVKAALPHL